MIPHRVGLTLLVAACAGCAADRPPELSTSADALAPGRELYDRGRFDSARVVWAEALAAPHIAGTADEARLVIWSGLAAWRLGEFEDARAYGERGLALARDHGIPADVARGQNALGLLAWTEGRLIDAAGLFSAALASATAAGDAAGIVRASNGLGLTSYDIGRFEEARAAFELARDSARALDDARSEGRALANLGMLEIWTGDPVQALDVLAAARARAAAADDVVGLASALGQTGVAHMVLGQPGRALAALDSALVLARENGLRDEEANDLVVMAGIYADAGDAERALATYAAARSINDELGLIIESGTVLREEAVLRASRGATEAARRDVLQALTLHRQAESRREEFLDLLVLADIELRRADAASAVRQAQRAREIATELGSPQARLALALTDARIAEHGRDARTMLRVLDGTAADLPYGGPAQHAEADALRLRAWMMLGGLDSAIAAGRRAVASIESVREGFAAGPLRTSYVADRSRVYADLVVALLAHGDSAGAFAVADAARGRAILEHLGAARGDVARGALRDLVEAERLLRRIDQLVAQLAREDAVPRRERSPAHEAASTELLRHLEQARSDYSALLVRAGEREPARARLAGARAAADSDIRSALAADEALIEYLVTGDHLFTFVLTTAGMRVHVQPVGHDELVHRVQLARDLFAAPAAAGRDRAVSSALYNLLIQPTNAAPGMHSVRHLFIVPHGALSYLPFAALRNAATDRILAEDFALSMLPAAGVLPLLRGRSASAPVGAAVFAPLPRKLPASAAELDAVRRALPRVKAFSGGRATEASVRNALAQPQIVHVATHGVMNARNPLFSRIELARGRNGSTDDGRLEVHELLDMDVRSPLVFLSGCQTGLGAAWSTAFSAGEDFATLSQAFLLAGAGSVVATLWRIDDAGAAAFAERFYHHLAGRPPAEALAAAQLDLRRSSRWSSPWYWAGYTLSGAAPAQNPRPPSVQ